MEQIIGRSCRALFPTICEQIIEAEDRALAGEGPVVDDVELIVERERRTYRTVTFTLPGATGEAAEICTIATDVTERRAAEHACSQRRHWERVIDAALAEGRMRVYGQPVVSLATGTAGNAGPATPRELLVRMVSESGELLLPADFLPEAERHGLIGRIDVWMVRQAVRLARSHQVSVNLSPLTISDDGAREQVLEVVRGAQDLPSGRLIFELTETAAPGDLDVACRFAAQVQALGGRLALDDFGTGFGSFTYLRRMPLCFLKIDASFVRHSSDSAADRAVVRSMVDIARQFGLRTVAEGVEDAFTLALIRDAGVDNAQGYLLGVPAEMSLPD
jgi:EAL domain-containing protein (putative c-di-GMP-specific phosphodiesterase class I)